MTAKAVAGDLLPEEVARELRLKNARQVTQLIQTGVLDGYAVNPHARRKRYRVTRAALDAFKRRNSVSSVE
jgi:hypothetical protein